MLDRFIFGLRSFFFRSKVDQFFGELLQQLELSVVLGRFMKSRSAAAQSQGSFLAPVYVEMAGRFADGRSFSESGEGILSNLNILMIQAGERVNNVIEGVRTARFLNQSMAKINAVIFQTLWWPVTMLLIATVATFFFGLTIVPEFTGLIPLSNLGASYQFAMPVATWTTDHVLVVLILAAALSYAVWYGLFNLTGRARAILDVIVPPFNIFRLKKAGELLIIFSGLIRNGVQIDEVLSIVIERECKYVRWHLELMRERIADGFPLVGGVDDDGLVKIGALDTGLLPSPVIEQLMSFNNSGKLEHAMQRIGFENVDELLLVVKVNVVLMANVIKVIGMSVISWLVYDTLTLSSKLMAFSQSSQF